MLKRYLVFYGTFYYLSGGMEDFIGHFDTIEEAYMRLYNRHLEETDDINQWGGVCQWAHIYDSLTSTILWNSSDHGDNFKMIIDSYLNKIK